jgi:hypothetical protein
MHEWDIIQMAERNAHKLCNNTKNPFAHTTQTMESHQVIDVSLQDLKPGAICAVCFLRIL